MSKFEYKTEPMKKWYILYLMLVCAALTAQVVPLECATPVKAAWRNTLQQKVSKLNDMPKNRPAQFTAIPVQFHLIVKANSTSSLTIQQIRHEMDSVNAFYANADMSFYECSAPEIIYDDSLYNYEYMDEEVILLSQHYTNDVINIYFANTVAVGGTNVCGYSQFPPSMDYAVIAAACATNGSTLAHEFGHYFGLFHTHGDISQGELVDGSNCAFDGDLICDTPADPTLSSANVNISCMYIGTDVDANLMPYAPDVSNIMSYSRKHCRTSFTAEQYAVMYNTMQSERSNLYCPVVTGVMSYAQADLHLYPNPGTNKLMVNLGKTNGLVEVNLYNTIGECVYTSHFTNNEFEIATGQFPSGIYFYNITTENFSYTGKWVKSN